QLVFEGGGGAEVGDDGVAEGVPLVGIFAGQDGALGAQPVPDGVEGRALLPFGGARAGGVAGHDVPRGESGRATNIPEATGGAYVVRRAESRRRTGLDGLPDAAGREFD